MIEPVDIGIKVALQVFGADGVVDAIDSPLRVTPEAFDIVGMGASCNVLLGAVDHGFMGIAETGKVIVGSVFVGVDGSIVGMDVFLNHRDDGGCLAVGLYLDHGVALALNQAYHHGLAYGSASGVELFGFVLVPFLPADVSLINFYLSEQRDAVFLGHQLTDLGEHPPGRLVGDADLPFKLLGRYARPGGSHEEHGVKPGAERSRGLVEDGICRGGYLGAAELAAINLSALDAVVGSDLLAGGAGDAIGPSGGFEEVQAGVIGGELGVELFDCVLLHAPMISDRVRDVKG